MALFHGPLPRAACVALALLGGCATTDASSTSAQADPSATPHHHHHRRHHDATDVAAEPGAMPTTGAMVVATADGGAATTGVGPGTSSVATAAATDPNGDGTVAGSIGTPVTVGAGPTVFQPRYVTRAGHAMVVCEGASRVAHARCPQCGETPDNAAIVRAFVPAERSVLQCEPPANAEGRLPMHATFGGNGLLLEVSFPGVAIDQGTSLCIGAALCRIHTPTFRTAESSVDYEYVVLVPGAAPTGG